MNKNTINTVVIGKSDLVNPSRSVYVLLKEKKGYIFRQTDKPDFGWNGHHKTKEFAIESFKSLGSNVIVEVSF